MSSAVLHLTQLYSKQTYSDPSVAISAKESDDEQSDDNQNWSWRYLKSEFINRDTIYLFHKYQARLQSNFFMILLILNMSINIIAVIMSFWDEVCNFVAIIYDNFYPSRLLDNTNHITT